VTTLTFVSMSTSGLTSAHQLGLAHCRPALWPQQEQHRTHLSHPHSTHPMPALASGTPDETHTTLSLLLMRLQVVEPSREPGTSCWPLAPKEDPGKQWCQVHCGFL
jgi:hypothetical protein